jgi:peptidyl-tRNA hydrolase
VDDIRAGEPAAPDREAAPQLVLPLVVRMERAAPPQRTDALEAAAGAVLELLNDPRATAGEWAASVRSWEAGHIRKVVRRARGAAWSRAVALSGLTVVVRSAEVRVHPPIPLDGWPPDLARLQVGGTELVDTTPPPAPAPSWPVLWINPGLDMTAGKAMAQAGHAAQLAWWASGARARAHWAASGFALAVRRASPSRWAVLLDAGLPVVQDGGFTEVAPGSRTVVADLPWLRRTGMRGEGWHQGVDDRAGGG